jgi:hypothetical protein
MHSSLKHFHLQITSFNDRMPFHQRLLNTFDQWFRTGALFFGVAEMFVRNTVPGWGRLGQPNATLALFMQVGEGSNMIIHIFQSTMFDYPRPLIRGLILKPQWGSGKQQVSNSHKHVEEHYGAGFMSKCKGACDDVMQNRSDLKPKFYSNGSIVFSFTTMGRREDTPDFIKRPIKGAFESYVTCLMYTMCITDSGC